MRIIKRESQSELRRRNVLCMAPGTLYVPSLEDTTLYMKVEGLCNAIRLCDGEFCSIGERDAAYIVDAELVWDYRRARDGSA